MYNYELYPCKAVKTNSGCGFLSCLAAFSELGAHGTTMLPLLWGRLCLPGFLLLGVTEIISVQFPRRRRHGWPQARFALLIFVTGKA